MNDDQIKLIGFYIDEIYENMSDRDFQRDFFESLSDQYNKRNSLSLKQIESLKKIYERVTDASRTA